MVRSVVDISLFSVIDNRVYNRLLRLHFITDSAVVVGINYILRCPGHIDEVSERY